MDSPAGQPSTGAQPTAASTAPVRRKRRIPQPMCPLRPGDPCTLCQPGASGPHDCATVLLVKDDPELQEAWLEARRAKHRAAH